MIEPVNVPIILDLELSQVEYDLSVEEAEEYAAQIGSLITISEVYGGLPSGGSLGNIIIKNSEEDYDASWYAPASIVEEGNGLPVTSEAVYDAIISSNPKPYDDSPAALGTANPGHSELYARGDHVHPMPRAADIGAYTKPSDGIPASDLADDVHLIPSGGTIGQILRKISNSDWDIEWADESGGGSNFVEYGTGTNAQIEAFYQAEQMCACIRNSGYVLPLVLRMSASYHVFSAAYNNTVYIALCRNNEWWTVTRELAQLSDIPDVDDALSDTSENPVQNKVIKAALDAKGTYSKPSGGIPKTDLASDVQTSLDKADTALQNSPVFVCTYGTTTATEVADALTAGKIVVVRYAENIYELSYLGDLGNDRIYYFTNVAANKVNTLSLIQSTWTNEGGWTIPFPSSSNPSALGTAAPGTSSLYARADHVHPKPTAGEIGAYVKPSGGIPETDLASAVQTSLGKADTALQSAPVTSVNNQTGAVILTASDVGAGTYSKPSGGIPKTDLESAVQTSLGKADTAYQKPSGGIPKTDLTIAIQSSLDKADSALQSAPVTSVNGQTGAVNLSIPSIASDISAVAIAQGSAHAGEFLVVGSNGNVTTMTLTTWQGGNY